MSSSPAVFLDRDGVINANLERDGCPVAPKTLAEFKLLPGVADTVRRLKERGYLVIVVTNQPDVANGLTERATVDAMHDVIRTELAVDCIEVYFHNDAAGCDCRKPKPGMILKAAAEHGIDILSVTAGATLRPAAQRAVRRFLLITATSRMGLIIRIWWCGRWWRRQISSFAQTRAVSETR